MPLPVLVKSYTYTINQTLATSGNFTTDNAILMKTVKDLLLAALTGGAAHIWSCIGSCDATTAALDATDRWTAANKINWGTGAHSWIVLRNLIHGFYLCIDCNSATISNATIVFSPSAGFTGGSTTARPTATDEYVDVNAVGWVNNTSAATFRLHLITSTDGTVTHLIVCKQTTPILYFGTMPITNPVTGWSSPWITGWQGVSNILAMAGLATVTGQFYARIASINAVITFTSEGISAGLSANQLTAADDQTGEMPLFPFGVGSSTTGARGAHKGDIIDLWAGSSVASPTADSYPADGSRQFMQFVHTVFPWNGVAVITT